MNIVVLTNGNYFSHLLLRRLFEQRATDIKCVYLSDCVLYGKSDFEGYREILRIGGWRHFGFKVFVYGFFRLLRPIKRLLGDAEIEYTVADAAATRGIPLARLADVNAGQAVEAIAAWRPDLIVSVSLNQRVKRRLLRLPRLGCINIHAALLPRYGGMTPYLWVLARGESETGITVHYMNESFDAGDIILQRRIPIATEDTAFGLFHKCCEEGAVVLAEAVDLIERGEAKPQKQDRASASYFSWPTKEAVRTLRRRGRKLMSFRDVRKLVTLR